MTNLTQMPNNLDFYYQLAKQEGLYKSAARLKRYTSFLFQGTDFTAKRVLDIGGGSGLFSFYAALRGAREVICLEPEGDGSSKGIQEKFVRVRQRLSLADSQVHLLNQPLQSLPEDIGEFDLLLLHNSINHLDEAACIHFLEGGPFRQTYLQLFLRLYQLTAAQGCAIICDCSPQNFFASLHVLNPFVPTIEWHKHQTPETWLNLSQEVGFVKNQLRWTPYVRFYVASFLTSNKFISYFLASHFCLSVCKS